MKKLGFILIFLTTVFTSLFAQEKRDERFARIRAVKIGLITERLNLSAKQAENFWPIYHKYEKEFRALRKAAKANGTRDELKYQEDKLNLRKRYRIEFLKVISEKQVKDLYDTERDFKQLLLQQLKKDGSNSAGRKDYKK